VLIFVVGVRDFILAVIERGAVSRGKFPLSAAHVVLFLVHAGFPNFQVGGLVSNQLTALHALGNPRLLVGFTLRGGSRRRCGLSYCSNK
jgi:hypothetical protein